MRRLETLDIASERPHLVLDIETTGRDYDADRIVAVGALLFPDGIFGEKPHTRFQWFFNPEPVRSTDEAYDVHRLTPDFLKQHDAFDQFNRHVKDLHGLMFHYPVSGACPVIVAHSALFDLSFIKQAFERISFWYPEDRIRYYCTKQWAEDRSMLSKLDSQLERWGLPGRSKHHDALHDAWMTAQVAFRQGLEPDVGFHRAKERELPPAFDQSPYKRKILIRCPDSVSDTQDDVEQAFDSLVDKAKHAADLLNIIGKDEPGDDIIEGRQASHGNFEDNARYLDSFMEVANRSDNWYRLSAVERTAIMLILSKISRYLSQENVDHARDVVGYGRLLMKEAIKLGHVDSGAPLPGGKQ